jgi:uncharacterized protein (DUF362 family)
MNRRNFLKTTAAAIGSLAASRLFAETAAAAVPAPTVWVVQGKNISAMLQKGMQLAGGWGAFVKKEARVTLKPNAAWAVKPEDGANTHPELVRAFCLGAFAAGAKSVSLPELSCSPAAQAFAMSGIEAALKGTGARLYKPEKDSEFRKIAIPRGVAIQEARVPVDVLDCDCLVNMPVAKSHGAATLTLSMKNWMGSDQNRGTWHRKNLHQCIADFSTAVKPTLIIIDAIRIMTTKGPRGPGEMKYPEKIILGLDPVACDAVATTLFGLKPFDIPFIRMAHDMGVGCGDLAAIKIVEATA